jgi:hypothetical protein
MIDKPYLIEFPKIGESQLGYISICEKENLPFVPKRIYWTYFTPEEVVRGQHGHYELEQILIAAAGKIEANILLKNGENFHFVLDSPNIGVFIPKMAWRTMKYSHNSVQICIASMEYDENDYIREFTEFKKLSYGI